MGRGAPEAELAQAREGCVLADRSDLGRLLATGPDFLDLLHRLSTGNVAGLTEGDGRPTVLTTPKGRIVERLFVHHLGPAGVLSIGGPGCGARVLAHLGRYTFAEDTGLSDVTDGTCQLALIGPRAGEALVQAGLPRPEPYRTAAASIGNATAHVLGQDGGSGSGFSVVAPRDGVAAVRKALSGAVADVGGLPTGREVLEAHRVLGGIPAAGHELTDEHNPLEAGLWDAVDFDKGCYVGQEVVARLRTYDKVARSIVGLELPEGVAPPDPGAKLNVEGREVGVLTSAVLPPGRPAVVALGYVKRKEIRADLELQIGDGGLTARLVVLPFRG